MGRLEYQLDMISRPKWYFVNASPFAKDNLLYLQETGWFFSGKSYYTERSGLDSLLLIFTLSGKGILEYCGEKYELVPDTVMLIDCKLPQHYYTDRSIEKWETSWVHFNGFKAIAYYEKFIEKNSGSPVARMTADNSVNEILESVIRVAANYTKSQDNEIIADNLLNTLLKECILKCGNTISQSSDYIGEIATYLRHHYKDEISLETLEKEFNISRFHLQRVFKTTMGVSPAKYLTNLRINAAKRLLRGTALSVNEISEQVGLEPNYFIQLFKSLENETPGQYRRKWCGK